MRESWLTRSLTRCATLDISTQGNRQAGRSKSLIPAFLLLARILLQIKETPMKKTPINPVAIALLFLLVMTGLWLVITDAIRFAREAAVPIPPTPATVVVSAEPTEI